MWKAGLGEGAQGLLCANNLALCSPEGGAWQDLCCIGVPKYKGRVSCPIWPGTWQPKGSSWWSASRGRWSYLHLPAIFIMFLLPIVWTKEVALFRDKIHKTQTVITRAQWDVCLQIESLGGLIPNSALAFGEAIEDFFHCKGFPTVLWWKEGGLHKNELTTGCGFYVQAELVSVCWRPAEQPAGAWIMMD